MKIPAVFFTAIIFVTASSCTDSSEKSAGSENSGPPVVACVNYPLAYFAERIGGDAITVHFPEIDGDPAFWEPTDSDVVKFQNADLILRNGATYAKWTDKVSLPIATQVDTSTAFRGALIEVEDGATHAHGDGKAHSHKGIAFTTWLDFENAGLQAQTVADALTKLVPEKSAEFAKRAEDLKIQLAALDEEAIEICRRLKDRALVASHPVYQYFVKAYGLKVKELHWEPDADPGEEGMAELRAALEDFPATAMIWEDEPLAESIAKLKVMGIDSLIFSPAGNRPENGDFLSVMKSNLENLNSLVIK